LKRNFKSKVSYFLGKGTSGSRKSWGSREPIEGRLPPLSKLEALASVALERGDSLTKKTSASLSMLPKGRERKGADQCVTTEVQPQQPTPKKSKTKIKRNQ